MDSLSQSLHLSKNDLKEDLEEKKNDSNKNRINIIKSSIGIIFVIVVITSLLLIGYFKFNLFKSSKDIDSSNINIKRMKNQVYYYLEKKTIKSKVGYSSGDSKEIEQIIDTEFMVILTDTKQSDKGKDILNYATLVILNSKIKMENNETDLNYFDIFNESMVSEFEQNPNGSQYPLSKFEFFQNGTISKIYLPKDMDKYNAQVTIELINNIIVKYIRKKKEDKENKLNDKLNKENQNKFIVSEIQEPKEYSDEYTKINYTGSKFSKQIEREIEDEKIKKIKTNVNLNLQTQNKEKDIINFGLDNYNLNTQSDISLIGYEEEKKEIVKFVEKLMEKIEFIKNDELINSIILKEKKEFENEQKKSENNNDFEIEENNSPSLRKLGWSMEFSYSWDVLKTDILGQSISIRYENILSNGIFQNQLVLNTRFGIRKIGNSYITENKIVYEISFPDIPLFTMPFPGCPFPISFNLIIGGSIGYSVSFNGNFKASLTGELIAKAEIEFEIKNIISISIGAEGVILGINANTNIAINS